MKFTIEPVYIPTDFSSLELNENHFSNCSDMSNAEPSPLDQEVQSSISSSDDKSKSKRKEKKEKLDSVESVQAEKEKVKRKHVWTEKKKQAFEKCRAARLASIAKRQEERKAAAEQK
jgi:uncharacterized protein YaiL (DUF2058 family)